MPPKKLLFGGRDLRSFSSREWTKQAVVCLLSAEDGLVGSVGSVVTREALRLWALSESKTTYLESFSEIDHYVGRYGRPQGHAGIQSHWR